ncbi:MAG: hypothetical protein QM784_19735 [Polyangiaceae bacterium]
MATKVGQYCIYVSDIREGRRVLHRGHRPQGAEPHRDRRRPRNRRRRRRRWRATATAERYNDGQPIDHSFALWKIYFIVDDAQAIHDKAVAYGCDADLRAPTTRPLAGDRGILPRPRRLPRRAHPVRHRITSTAKDPS